jgi:hypothetical protein
MAMIAVVLCALVVVGFFQTATATSESLCNQHVSKKIAKLERQGEMVDSWSACVKGCAEFEILKANFFRTHREELVREMVALKVEMKPYKVDYFFIKAFSNAYPKLACQHCSSHHSGQSFSILKSYLFHGSHLCVVVAF